MVKHIAIILTFSLLLPLTLKSQSEGETEAVYTLGKIIIDQMDKKGYFEKYPKFLGTHERVFYWRKNGNIYWYRAEQVQVLFLPMYVKEFYHISAEEAHLELMSPEERREYDRTLIKMPPIFSNPETASLFKNTSLMTPPSTSIYKIDFTPKMQEGDLPFYDAWFGKIVVFVVLRYLVLLYLKNRNQP